MAKDVLLKIFRSESPAVLATLVQMSGDLDQAEDALQEAMTIATEKWSEDGVPVNPAGWIMTTARRRLIDSHRRSSNGRDKERFVGYTEEFEPEFLDESRLVLLFTCCHPALSLETRVALTLRTICGLTTEEVAQAFVVQNTTMAQRLVRAKSKIRDAKIRYEKPDPDHWEPRLAAVLATVYLTFNQGYDLGSDSRGLDLAETAVELGRLLNVLIPAEPEIEGLLALMLFSHARRRARQAGDGMVLLETQERALWDDAMLDEAVELLTQAVSHGSVGQYWLQAAIAAEHVTPADFESRDWSRIVVLYDKLLSQTRNSPVVQLNRALAIAHSVDAAAGLAEVETLSERLGGYLPFHAARGHLLAQVGDFSGAAHAYDDAMALSANDQQRQSLSRALQKIEELAR